MSVKGVSCSCFSYCKAFGDAHEAEKKSNSSAQFLFIMKKILLFFVALLCSFGAAVAQVNFVATLQHGDAVSHYYGKNAFEEAYKAAADGDVITLSPGTFSFYPDWNHDFRKGITVRGAGIDAVDKTFISDEIYFFSSDASLTTNIEGIVFNSVTRVRNAKDETSHGKINFIKNRFCQTLYATQDNGPTEVGPSVRVYNSIVAGVHIYDYTNPNFIFYNCYVKYPYSELSKSTTSSFVNCVINWISDAAGSRYLNFHNCIFNWTWDWYGGDDYYSCLPSTATCYNCLSINKTKLFQDVVSGGNNKTVASVAEIFKTYSKDYEYGETFELTAEAKKTYIGTDGTQIGMQGGLYPYNSTVQYPVITKFETAPQTTKEGKLTIDVQVDGK